MNVGGIILVWDNAIDNLIMSDNTNNNNRDTPVSGSQTPAPAANAAPSNTEMHAPPSGD